MRRSRGDRSFTTLPPIITSPAVGVSRPAIMRRRVVFPEPDGPRKTRNSPSSVARLTSLTAPSSPALKTFVRFRVSATAIAPALLPSGEDALVLGFRRLRGVLGRLVSPRDLGEHRRDDPGAERLGDAGGGVARVPHVRGPFEDVAQDLVLVR